MLQCDRWALRIQRLPTVQASMGDAIRLHFRPRPALSTTWTRWAMIRAWMKSEGRLPEGYWVKAHAARPR